MIKTKIAILGSTGSIGCSAISLLENELKGLFEVEVLSFHSNAKLALKQALSVDAKQVIATSKAGYEEIKKLSSGLNLTIMEGTQALKEACKRTEIEVVLLAIVGFCGLEFALDSILKDDKRILAIANKESIICGYHLISAKLIGSKTKVLPIDSEHNSLFRLLRNFTQNDIKSLFITASGGPFLGRKFNDLKDVSISEVIKHPIWNMGAKISVDSATMANKGLELIECYKLFPLKSGSLEAFVARGSLLHAGLTLNDGSSLWFLSNPEMKNHISYAICDEKIQTLNIPAISPKKLEFESLKQDEFPIFFIAKKIAEEESIPLSISFNILNEIAVSKFLQSQIKYTEILKIIEENLGYNPDNLDFNSVSEIEDLFSTLKIKLKVF